LSRFAPGIDPTAQGNSPGYVARTPQDVDGYDAARRVLWRCADMRVFLASLLVATTSIASAQPDAAAITAPRTITLR
jgi:hypothetical protein